MKKKNLLPIKWMLGILIILTAAVYWTTQQTQSKDHGILPAASSFSSQNNFFQFLANMIGIRGQSASSSEASKENNIPNQNEPMPTREHVPASGDVSPSTLPSKTASNVEAPQGTEPIAEQGSNTAQEKNNAGNTPGINAENNSKNTAQINSEYNSESSAGNNQENNSGINAENNPGANAENNPWNVSETNPENNPGNNSGDNSGNNPGTNADQIPWNLNSGANAENNPGNLSGNNSGNINQSNLPTINPIPSDSAVSQSIAQQNQQSDTLAALIAARQALVVPVQQQAEASKYQTVNSQSIPAPSTDQAPADAVAKMKSNQVMYH